MINKLVLENLKHRWVRTLLSALVVAVQVMSILTLIGLSRGIARRIPPLALKVLAPISSCAPIPGRALSRSPPGK